MKPSPSKNGVTDEKSSSGSSESDSESSSAYSSSDSSESGNESSESNETNVVLKVTYHLAQEKAISLQKNYICHMCGSKSTNQIAVASSDFSSSLYDLESLTSLRTFEGHMKTITNLRFSPSDPNQLISSSVDGTIRFWDTRKAGKSVLTFKDDTAQSNQLKPFLSFDISRTGHFLCAGTELFDGDAFLVFGDARTGKVLGGYWESHSDDITQVAFHPLSSDNVVSGSSDGLINIYDLRSKNEDDALINSLNTESTVDKLAWYLIGGTYKGISSILDTLDVQFWLQDGACPSSVFSRKDFSNSTKWKADTSYVVNIHQAASGDLLFLTGASMKDKERLAILQVKDENLLLKSELPGNKQRIRCSWFNDQDEIFVTAGEGGILSVWKPGNEEVKSKSGKIFPKTSPRMRPY